MSIFTKEHLFVHIPKTAGASIIKKIKEQHKIHKVVNDRTDNDNYHSTSRDCLNSINNLENLYKFTIVRNPWDRACSWFFFRKDIIEKNISNPKKILVNNTEKLKNELKIMDRGFNFWLERYVDIPWDHTWFKLAHSQHTWLDGIDFDLIIKYENLNEELHKIPNLNLEKLPNRHQSKNSNSDYRTLYNTKSIDTIKKIYYRDIEKFGYSFE